MRNLLFWVAFMLATGTLFAQAYEGPYPEIANGYGAFGNHPIAEKKFDNAYLLSNGFNSGDGGVELTMRYPSDVQGPVPTVLFASGWGQYNPSTFNKLLDFIASKGYCVVFTPYPTSSNWAAALYNGMNQAIDENTGVNAGDLNIIDKTRIGFFGHSLGGGDIFWLGHKFYVDHGYGSNAKFLFSVAGWIGFKMTEDFLANYPSDCKLRVEIWEEDNHDPNSNPPGGTSPRIQYYLFHQINIPDSEKNYVKVFGGADDAPGNNGYHYSTHHDLVTMSEYNALDYYAIFRPLDAMMDWTFNGVASAKGLALGTDTDMGPFPDLDKDYNTFVFEYGEDTYDYPCNDGGNPFKDQCPAAPLPIEVLEPLSARLDGNHVRLSWATATEHNNKGFGIQRSSDGVEWSEIGWAEGKGSTQVANSYRAVDQSPLEGINYYRYEQVDYDGKSSFSNVVSVEYQTRNHQIRLAPNPAVDEVTILMEPSGRVERVVIQTLSGKTIKTFGSNYKHLEINGLDAGMYIVSIQLENAVIEKMLLVR